METGSGLHGVWLALSVASNLLIVFGFVMLAVTVIQNSLMPLSVRISGAVFFVTGAVTHVNIAFVLADNRWMAANHGVQAVSVLWFVLGYWTLLRSGQRMAVESVSSEDSPSLE